MTAAPTDPAVAEALCLAGIDAVQLFGEDFSAVDQTDADPDLAVQLQHTRDLLTGVILYAQVLEATMAVLGTHPDPQATRRAARSTASAWRSVQARRNAS